MNGPAAVIAAGIGAGFFALGMAFYYQPSFIKFNAADLLTTNHSKARAAVVRLLHKPASAEFGGLRTVTVDNASYVCGAVNAKDRSDSYAGARAFVYTVSIDFARIDDDGQIASKHDAYRACPLSEDEERAKQEKIVITPRQLEMAQAIQKAIPAADPSTLTTMSGQMSQMGGGAHSTAISQSGQVQGQPASASASGVAGQQGNSAFKATPENESEWQSDKLPSAWPKYPPGHKLASTNRDVAQADAISMAKNIGDRWARYKAGATKARPSTAEVDQALRALMSIDRNAHEFPQAWGEFVRLRKIDREMSA